MRPFGVVILVGWTMMETEPNVDPTAGPGGFLPHPTMAVLEVLP
jgi:hypothetical protein